jgi:catechol 2,3-dioxygenase-like lactoylglutathione lyase family enzyme
MKRFHVHVGVRNLDESIRFYSGLFGTEPTVRKPDYAKWMVDDPRINFAISQRSTKLGVNHLGLQVDESQELPEIKQRFAAADKTSLIDETGVTCCYAKSDKHWVTDPQGVAWEGWHSLGQVEIYGATNEMVQPETVKQGGCCTPTERALTTPVTTKAGCCS